MVAGNSIIFKHTCHCNCREEVCVYDQDWAILVLVLMLVHLKHRISIDASLIRRKLIILRSLIARLMPFLTLFDAREVDKSVRKRQSMLIFLWAVY